ncbi:Exocyst complex component EXO70B1, partial [Mucuna pruriens]
MVRAGLKEECLHEYTSCRREFLDEILSIFALPTFMRSEFKIRQWIRTLWVAERILLPNERRLCERVFEGSIPAEDTYRALPRIDELRFRHSLGIFGNMLYLSYGLQATVPDSGIHRITRDVFHYLEMIVKHGLSEGIMVDPEEYNSPSKHVAKITEMLESSLEANSKNYHNPALGYVFIINNWRCMELGAINRGLGLILGNSWLGQITTKIEKNLQLYGRSSWNMIVDFLKLDINESEPNVELLKEKLHLFNEHFDEICINQSSWFVFGGQLRKQIIESIENILLPAYGNFLGRFQDFLGKQAYEYIEYGMFDVQDRLNNLFLMPKVWSFVCFISSIVGLLCYALSSPFNNLFGNWSWWKILLYIVFSIIISLAVLFAKALQHSTSPWLEAHMAFFILTITTVYSFFFDKEVKGKPDAYSLISFAAFAIMSLGLSKLSHFGFEVDLLYFFSGLLTLQLMKIKLWLVIVGVSFSYSLIILRSTLDPGPRNEYIGVQDGDQGDIENGLHPRSQGIRGSASEVDSAQAIIIGTSNVHLGGDEASLENENIAFLVTQVSSDSQGNIVGDSDNKQLNPLPPSYLSSRKDKNWIAEKKEREQAQLREQNISSLIELLSTQRSISRHVRIPRFGSFKPVIDSCTAIEKERIGKILIARFTGRIEALKRKNGTVISTISKHVDRFLKASVVDEDQILVSQIDRDDNLVVDGLVFDDKDNIVGDLGETAKMMVMLGIEEECCRPYCSWRREFLKECLSAVGLQMQELNMEDTDKMENNQCWIKALSIAVRILFPNERRLCDLVFGRFTTSADFTFTEVCTELVTHLMSIANALANSFRKTLEELMYEFELVFCGQYSKSLNREARRIGGSLAIFVDSENLFTDGGGRLLAITHEVIVYLCHNSVEKNSIFQPALEGMLSPYVQVSRITRLFERTLKAISKNYNNSSLGYVFILNNRSYIQQEVSLHGLEPIGYDWLQKNKRKIEKNLQLYSKSSWNKIVDFLKLDINESEPNVAAQLMKDKLRSFNEHFDDICNDQSMWFVFGDQLRKQIIELIENMLLPAYGNFIGRLQDFLGNHAYKYIEYGIFDVQDRVNNLFLLRKNTVFIMPIETPKVWSFVCFVSSVVELVCYALNFSFNNLFRKWIWWKILLYIDFSFFSIIIFLAVWLAKPREGSTSPSVKVNTAFLVMLTTSVFSYYFDKEVKGKPDSYSLATSAAFAIMSLGLSQVTSDLGLITSTISVSEGVSVISSTFFVPLWTLYLKVCILDPNSIGAHVIDIDSGRHDSASQIMSHFERLKKENGNLINTISNHVGEYLKANVVSEDQRTRFW